MINIKMIWEAQVKYVRDIVEDILKNQASEDVCRYADSFARIESPYGTSGGDSGSSFIRVNFGEAYAYLDILEDNTPAGTTWWNVDEMDCKGNTCEEILKELKAMPLETAVKNCSYIDCYDDCEGKEKEYMKKLSYKPFSS